MVTSLFLVASAQAADVDFVCTPGDATGVVGLPPLTVTCDVVAPAVGTWDEVTWTFGDGAVVSGDSASFTYEDIGQYAITVRLENYEDAGAAADEPDPQAGRVAFVTVCGAPEPRFDFENMGGLEYRLVNTSIIAPRCLDSSRWLVWEGREPKGKPAFEFSTWEPRFELPREGFWTVRLENEGIGGSEVAERVLEAEYKLADKYEELDPLDCATTPLAAGWGALGLLAALVRRRAR